MKILFWSTFAMSLILTSAWAQVEGINDADEILNMNLDEDPSPVNRPVVSGENEVLKVDDKEVEKDSTPLKGQNSSLIPWSTQDPEEWLSIHRWLDERDVKDKNPDWKNRLRDDRQLELVGKIIKCSGECPVYRGANGVFGQHLTRLVEGDELQTGKDSVAWVYLMDGTLMRVGPQSSVSMQEINWSKSEVFYHMRLNRGHAFWHPRSSVEYALDDAPETDALALPVPLKMANQEFYERENYKRTRDEERFIEFLEPSGFEKQIKAINERKAKNSPSLTHLTRVMMVAPNASVLSSNMSFDFVAVNGGKAYVKKRTTSENEDFALLLRGYSDKQRVTDLSGGWQEIDATGRSHAPAEEGLGTLQLIELLTKRIKTLELVREIWIEDFTLPVLKDLNDPKTLATHHGYSLWGDDLIKRQEFLVEYTRRIETTNLRSLENLLVKLEANGEKVSRELTSEYHQGPLIHYLKGLKTRYTAKKLQLREMNDLQYYVWILKNGKL